MSEPSLGTILLVYRGSHTRFPKKYFLGKRVWEPRYTTKHTGSSLLFSTVNLRLDLRRLRVRLSWSSLVSGPGGGLLFFPPFASIFPFSRIIQTSLSFQMPPGKIYGAPNPTVDRARRMFLVSLPGAGEQPDVVKYLTEEENVKERYGGLTPHHNLRVISGDFLRGTEQQRISPPAFHGAELDISWAVKSSLMVELWSVTVDDCHHMWTDMQLSSSSVIYRERDSPLDKRTEERTARYDHSLSLLPARQTHGGITRQLVISGTIARPSRYNSNRQDDSSPSSRSAWDEAESCCLSHRKGHADLRSRAGSRLTGRHGTHLGDIVPDSHMTSPKACDLNAGQCYLRMPIWETPTVGDTQSPLSKYSSHFRESSMMDDVYYRTGDQRGSVGVDLLTDGSIHRLPLDKAVRGSNQKTRRSWIRQCNTPFWGRLVNSDGRCVLKGVKTGKPPSAGRRPSSGLLAD
ncbi:hypothetical protein Bbelb_408960 [Branchiostoma belcheri]|nr:hypothetical protein Bbelb_408960 [Branchiostoma belcheri]